MAHLLSTVHCVGPTLPAVAPSPFVLKSEFDSKNPSQIYLSKPPVRPSPPRIHLFAQTHIALSFPKSAADC
jgi:hypothetical protein